MKQKCFGSDTMKLLDKIEIKKKEIEKVRRENVEQYCRLWETVDKQRHQDVRLRNIQN